VGARLAADHPRRVGALVLYASVARVSWAPDYDWALTHEERTELIEMNVAGWGEEAHNGLAMLAPSSADDPSLAWWFARMQRLAASPVEARMLFRGMADLDVRDALPQIRVPTLVLHRREDTAWDVRHSRYLADNIAGSRFVELDGIDSLPF